MRWQSDSETRRNGERAHERNQYGRFQDNPHDQHSFNYDENRRHRLWDDGFSDAQRAAERRQEEETARERQEQQRQYDLERHLEYQRQEEEERQAELEAEEQEYIEGERAAYEQDLEYERQMEEASIQAEMEALDDDE